MFRTCGFFLYGVLPTALAFIAYWIMNSNRHNRRKAPKVSNWLPFFGHLWKIISGPKEYFKNCRKRYGNIFRIQLNGTDLTIVCDRKAAMEITKAEESILSIDDIFHENYFVYAFYGSRRRLRLRLLRKASSTTQPPSLERFKGKP